MLRCYFTEAICILTFCLSNFGTWLLLRACYALKLFDVPNERSSHSIPKPRIGGLAFSIIIISAFFVIGKVYNNSVFKIIGITSLLISLLGLIDDIIALKFSRKLLPQLILSSLTVFQLIDFSSMHYALVLTALFWIIGLINAYNFMDGIDGLAGGQAVVASLAWFAIAHHFKVIEVEILSVVIAGSVLGFLFFNWAPSKIFMGDTGSTLLGMVFATIPLYFVKIGYSFLQMLFVGFLILAPFVIDSFTTFFIRLLKKENVFKSHRKHFYQKWVINGASHKYVALNYIATSCVTSFLAYGLALY